MACRAQYLLNQVRRCSRTPVWPAPSAIEQHAHHVTLLFLTSNCALVSLRLKADPHRSVHAQNLDALTDAGKNRRTLKLSVLLAGTAVALALTVVAARADGGFGGAGGNGAGGQGGFAGSGGDSNGGTGGNASGLGGGGGAAAGGAGGPGGTDPSGGVGGNGGDGGR